MTGIVTLAGSLPNCGATLPLLPSEFAKLRGHFATLREGLAKWIFGIMPRPGRNLRRFKRPALPNRQVPGPGSQPN